MVCVIPSKSLDTLVSFDFVGLFANIPIDDALQVIRNKLHNDGTGGKICLSGRSHHGFAGGLLEIHIFLGGQVLPTER
jgi:hypothetical protein